jgi:hypothetical protein
VIKWNLLAIALCGLMLLGGCNVGSDESQQSSSSAGSQTATTSTQGQTLKTTLSQTSTLISPTSVSTLTETYYLALHGLNAAGKKVTNSIVFQKSVKAGDSASVQLIWFEPNRQANGSCLQDLSSYELEYGQQPNSYNTKLTFDLAAREMSCTTVGVTECGDVRECRYKLSL